MRSILELPSKELVWETLTHPELWGRNQIKASFDLPLVAFGSIAAVVVGYAIFSAVNKVLTDRRQH